MSAEIVRILTCDRCGKQVILKKLREEERDGGYTRYSVYQENPSGWGHPSSKVGHLCPDCYQLYELIVIRHEQELKAEGFRNGEQ